MLYPYSTILPHPLFLLTLSLTGIVTGIGDRFLPIGDIPVELSCEMTDREYVGNNYKNPQEETMFRTENNEDGRTLVEQLVVIGLFTLMMTLIMLFFVNNSKVVNDQTLNSYAEQQANNAAMSFVRDTSHNDVETDYEAHSVHIATLDSQIAYTNSDTGVVRTEVTQDGNTTSRVVSDGTVELTPNDNGTATVTFAQSWGDGGATQSAERELTVYPSTTP